MVAFTQRPHGDHYMPHMVMTPDQLDGAHPAEGRERRPVLPERRHPGGPEDRGRPATNNPETVVTSSASHEQPASSPVSPVMPKSPSPAPVPVPPSSVHRALAQNT